MNPDERILYLIDKAAEAYLHGTGLQQKRMNEALQIAVDRRKTEARRGMINRVIEKGLEG